MRKTGKKRVVFASAVPEKMERSMTLPARLVRLLDEMAISGRVKGRTVAVKIHAGRAMGYSTVPPLFIRLVVEHLKKGSPRRVFVTDHEVRDAAARGYTEETVLAPVVPLAGKDGRDFKRLDTGWKLVPFIEVGKKILSADVLVNLSHVKGHGDCGFGGACKNIAMGCVTDRSRRMMHEQEGTLDWNRKRCTRCGRCIRECTTHANRFNKAGEYEIFWHHCRMCLHCMLACPEHAIKLVNPQFRTFQEALARTTKRILEEFDPSNVFHVNVLTQITLFCDCWGMTTPALVPDIGIFGSADIVAVDDASLRAIRTEDLISGSITPPYKLGKGGHLFEKLHGKDPFAQVAAMERLGLGTTDYETVKVK